MTISPAAVGAPPRRSPFLHCVRSMLTGAVIGGSLAALVVGTIVEHVLLFVAGLVVPTVYGLLHVAAAAPRRAREAAQVPYTALALIEERRATGGENSDVPVRFDVTVAPDGAPAYRVAFVQDINLVDLSDYRPGGIVVVQYPPDRPWEVRIVRRPTPEWEERAADARIDSAPGPAVTSDEPADDSAVVGYLTLLALLLAAAAVVLLFRAELFGPDPADPAAPPAATGPAETGASGGGSGSSSTVVSAATGTVTLGTGSSMLDQGELRRSMEALARSGGQDHRRVLTLVVQERQLTAVFTPTGSPTPGFDPARLPYDRIPALVREATTTLGVRAPRTWQLTAENLTGALTLRVGVTGAEGAAATLEADAAGTVQRRTPAH
ncbi:hypothetical protein [Streptomyces sp. NPDC048659]|uniref:hypothetical protein n=1 Tax=Streptomyces sp. NPDC048659 TaxID=3155489 RepID=UPI003432D6EC